MAKVRYLAAKRNPATPDRGGMRRAWLRGRANIHKRYLVYVAGYKFRADHAPICSVLSCRMLRFSPSFRSSTSTQLLSSPSPSKPTRSTEYRLSQRAAN
jgi:hypothetical protein